MKKLIIFISLIFVLSLPVIANEVEDFAASYRTYKLVHQSYDTAKNEYLKHRTLNSQNDSIAKTKDFLIQRNQMLRTYLMALRYRLHTTFGVDQSDLDNFTDQLNQEINFINQNTQRLEALATPTLPELFDISKEIELKQEPYAITSYHILSTVSYTKVKNLYNQFSHINNQLKTYTDSSSISYIRNWHNNSLQTQQRIDSQLEDIKVLVNNWSQAKYDQRTLTKFTNLNNQLETTRQELIRGISYQKEIMVKLEQEFQNQK